MTTCGEKMFHTDVRIAVMKILVCQPLQDDSGSTGESQHPPAHPDRCRLVYDCRLFGGNP
jgi:hypothetical protein